MGLRSESTRASQKGLGSIERLVRRRDHHRHGRGTVGQAEGEFPLDVAELGIDPFESDPAPSQMTLDDGSVSLLDRHPTQERVLDPIRPSPPRERRVPPPDPNPKGTMGGFDDEGIAPTVVLDSVGSARGIADVSPAVTTATDLEFPRSLEDAIPEETDPHLDRHEETRRGRN